MSTIEINTNDLQEREQYSLRLLKAKAQFRKLVKQGHSKPRYASFLMQQYPSLRDKRSEVYAALNDHRADEDILRKFEKLVFDVLPNE